jgi:hypothetical protein
VRRLYTSGCSTDIERVRQGVIAEGRQHGIDAVWIESVVIGTTSTADFRSLATRPDVVGRLTKVLDELAGGDLH